MIVTIKENNGIYQDRRKRHEQMIKKEMEENELKLKDMRGNGRVSKAIERNERTWNGTELKEKAGN